jgi:hypothetical protein
MSNLKLGRPIPKGSPVRITSSLVRAQGVVSNFIDAARFNDENSLGMPNGWVYEVEYDAVMDDGSVLSDRGFFAAEDIVFLL